MIPGLCAKGNGVSSVLKDMRAIAVDEHGDAPRNPIASMVDVAFLLLIFFLVATTITPRERDLPMALPGDAGSSPVSHLPAIITIERDGSVHWGEAVGRIPVASEEGDLGGLDEMLRISVAVWGEDQPGVMLKVDDQVGQQRFVDVLDTLAGRGVEKLEMID